MFNVSLTGWINPRSFLFFLTEQCYFTSISQSMLRSCSSPVFQSTASTVLEGVVVPAAIVRGLYTANAAAWKMLSFDWRACLKLLYPYTKSFTLVHYIVCKDCAEILISRHKSGSVKWPRSPKLYKALRKQIVRGVEVCYLQFLVHWNHKYFLLDLVVGL